MKQLFEVGEKVLLRSKYLPQYDGEYLVTKVYFPGEPSPCPIGSGYYTAPDFAYCLGFSFEYDGGICDSFQQKSLRKKHIPGEFRYNELIKNLNTKIQERC